MIEFEPSVFSSRETISSVSIESRSTYSLKNAFSMREATGLPIIGIVFTSLSIQRWITAPFDESNALTLPVWSTSARAGASEYHFM